MTKLSNSLAQADIATALHPYTNARRHEERGPLVIGFLDIDLPDGTRTRAELKTGIPYFRETGVEHNVLNGNDFECAFIEVEFLTADPKGF